MVRESKPSPVDITEATYQEAIIQIARLYGWRVAHFRPAMTKDGWRTAVAADGKGYPDLTMVKPGRLIFAEIKSEKGKLSEDQANWIDAFKLVPGIEVYLWRPSQFEEVVALLRKPAITEDSKRFTCQAKEAASSSDD